MIHTCDETKKDHKTLMKPSFNGSMFSFTTCVNFILFSHQTESINAQSILSKAEICGQRQTCRKLKRIVTPFTCMHLSVFFECMLITSALNGLATYQGFASYCFTGVNCDSIIIWQLINQTFGLAFSSVSDSK